MGRFSKIAAAVAAALVISAVSKPVLADTLAVDFTGLDPDLTPVQSTFNLGFEFRANSAITVTGLGVYDYLGDGFLQDQQVGLWDSTGNKLASVFVHGSDSDPSNLVGAGPWRFTAIKPITLAAGASYVVGSQGGEEFEFDVTGFSVSPR